ncbi:MAG: hypothetical protein AAFZ63_17465 [Bacteroidota bacterium]
MRFVTVILLLLIAHFCKSQSDYELQDLEDQVSERIEEVGKSSLPRRAKIKRIRRKIDTLLSICSIREEQVQARNIETKYQLCHRKANLLRLAGKLEDSYHHFQTALKMFDDDEMKEKQGYNFDASSYYHTKRWLLIRLVEVHMEMKGGRRAAIRKLVERYREEKIVLFDVESLPADILKLNEYYEYVEKNFTEAFISEYLEAYYQPLSIWSYPRKQEDLLMDYFLKNYNKNTLKNELERLSEELIYEAGHLGHRLQIGFTFLGVDLCINPPRDLPDFDEGVSQNIYLAFVRTWFYDRLNRFLEE